MCLALLFRLMDLRTRYTCTHVFSTLASAMTLLPCDQLLNLIMATFGNAVAGLQDTKKWTGILKFSHFFIWHQLDTGSKCLVVIINFFDVFFYTKRQMLVVFDHFFANYIPNRKQ